MEQYDGVAMVADRMVMVPKHAIIDQVRGAITGFRAGKVKPGDKTGGRFTWRGPLHEAPMGAHCENPADQLKLEAARRAFTERQQMAGLAKKAEAASMAAHAAASLFKDTPQASRQRAVLEREAEDAPRAPRAPRRGWPKGKARKPPAAAQVNTESEPAVA